MVRHVARKHGGLGIPVNGKWYSIKQPVSEVFVKDNKLSAFYGKQPSNDRELEESDMFIIIMAELDDRSNTHVSQGNSDCHVYHRRMRMSNR